MCGTLGKRFGGDEGEAPGVRSCGEERLWEGWDCRWRGELVLPVKGDYNGKLPETSAATAAAKSRRFARGRCAFHLPDSRKHRAACHTVVVFPVVYASYIRSRSKRTCMLLYG